MALLNHVKKELSAKIVYYGPGLSGKTTNLEWIHKKMEPDKRGKLISLETKTDRTLFFDFLPVEIGEIEGYRVRFNVYTVPGQIFYNETRRMVLKGVDGVVFVADSQKELAGENRDSLRNLEENLRTLGRGLDEIPLVLQYNKRDLRNAMPVEDMERLLNLRGVPHFESIAVRGEGVLTTLARIARMVADHVKKNLFKQTPTEAPSIARPPSAPRGRDTIPIRPALKPPTDVTEAESQPSFLGDHGAPDTASPGPMYDGDRSPADLTASHRDGIRSAMTHDPHLSAGSVPRGDPYLADTLSESLSGPIGVAAAMPGAPPDIWMDPSVIALSPVETESRKPDDIVTVRLGKVEVAEQNELRIPILVRAGQREEEFSLQLSIRIDSRKKK